MHIQPIIQNFCFKAKRKDCTDRAVTLQDLYEMEDRINSKIDKQTKRINEVESSINNVNCQLADEQNKLLGQAFIDVTKLIYFRPLASSNDYYKISLKTSEAIKNNKNIL